MSRTKVGKVPSLSELDGVAFDGRILVEKKMNIEDLFADRRPLLVDIGCGKGLTLTQQPLGGDYNYLGIDKREKYACFVGQRIRKYELTNARVISGFIEPLIDTCFRDHSVDVCCILFPDPWHKKRHRKRRVVNDEAGLLPSLARILKPGGLVWVVTDHEEYFLSMSETFNACDKFELASDQMPPSGLTHFEIKYAGQGKSIYRNAFRLCGA